MTAPRIARPPEHGPALRAIAVELRRWAIEVESVPDGFDPATLRLIADYIEARSEDANPARTIAAMRVQQQRVRARYREALIAEEWKERA